MMRDGVLVLRQMGLSTCAWIEAPVELPLSSWRNCLNLSYRILSFKMERNGSPGGLLAPLCRCESIDLYKLQTTSYRLFGAQFRRPTDMAAFTVRPALFKHYGLPSIASLMSWIQPFDPQPKCSL